MVTTKTSLLTPGDVIKQELPKHASREAQTVKTATTIAIGDVLANDGSGLEPLVSDAVAVDEVHTIGITGTLTAGSFNLTFVDDAGLVQTTAPIAFDANTAAIQTGVDTALGASKVTVGGTAITAMTFTFDGAGYAGIKQTLTVLDVSLVTGVEDSTVTLTTVGGALSGADAEAVALEAVTAAAAGAKIVVAVRDCIVSAGKLAYGGATSVPIVDAKLLTLGIQVRPEASFA